MNEEIKSPEIVRFLDEMSLSIFGRSRSLALAANGCVKCGNRVDNFRDEQSKREYEISGLCGDCQDSMLEM